MGPPATFQPSAARLTMFALNAAVRPRPARLAVTCTKMPAKDVPKSNCQKSTIVPPHSLTKSKKGVVHIWIQLPRSVPESCLNMDAKPTHFHLDTKNWGSNYEVDIPFPADVSVILREGEEAEAEFQGGVLKVRFQTTESEKNGGGQALKVKSKRGRQETPQAKDAKRSGKRQKKETADTPKGLPFSHSFKRLA